MGRVAGPMTRTVTDAAMLMDALSRPDARDFMSLPFDETEYAKNLESIDARKAENRLSARHAAAWPVHEEVHAAAAGRRESAWRCRRGGGGNASFLTPRCSTAYAASSRRARTTTSLQLAPQKQGEGAALHRGVVHLARGALHRARSHAGVHPGHGDARGRGRRLSALRHVVSPVSPILPYPAEEAAPGNDPRNALPHIAFTVPYNMSSSPRRGQLEREPRRPADRRAGDRQRFDDAGVLGLARLLERLRRRSAPGPSPRISHPTSSFHVRLLG